MRGGTIAPKGMEPYRTFVMAVERSHFGFYCKQIVIPGFGPTGRPTEVMGIPINCFVMIVPEYIQLDDGGNRTWTRVAGCEAISSEGIRMRVNAVVSLYTDKCVGPLAIRRCARSCTAPASGYYPGIRARSHHGSDRSPNVTPSSWKNVMTA
jgi:hypothetical protein